MPLVKFGNHYISRLILGSNPICGFSHISESKDKEMQDYHTTANIKLTFDECVRNGINTVQARADRHIMRILNEYRNEGKSIQWIAQNASEMSDLTANLGQIVSNGAIAVFYHGTQTDNLWHTGISGIRKVEDDLKRLRDTGLFTGLGTHIPEVINHAESHGWDIDFYMASFYNLAKKPKHVQATSGFKEEHFNDEDTETMLKMVRQTAKQCLVFKILGAGRKTNSSEEIRDRFSHAFKNIKANDCVVVGMYQKYKNQVAENSRIVEEILTRTG